MSEIDTHHEDWIALSRLLDEALELPAGERARWIERLPAEHEALRPRLRRLLAGPAQAAATGFLETLPKLDVTPSSAGDDLDRGTPAPDTIGPYRVVRKLAEGGMGAVWLAHRMDGMTNRPVALKLPRDAWLGARVADRIATEREIMAALDHPNIARLYDAGIDARGQSYLALEYVEGRPIDEYARARQLTIRARLRLFLQVARAVAHAHTRLIVHRDLKPSNILVTDQGEPKLLDFGIAQVLDDSRTTVEAVPDAATRLLTPDYASPEQLAGRPIGMATDVYSSGVILYELLTGVRPHTRGRNIRPTAIAAAGPPRPSEIAPDAPTRRVLRGDLDAILLKALAPRPEDRYATIDALVEDLDRYLQHRPVLAGPDSPWYRLSKGLARNRLAVAAAASVLAAVLSGTGLAAWQAHVAFTEKAHAEEVRDFLVTLFRDASPYGSRGRALSAPDWLQHVKTRVDDRLRNRPALRVELLNIVGSNLLTLQDTAGADEVLTEALEEATRRLGPDHPQTIRARVLMTPVHRFRGRTREMRADLERLMPVLRANRRAFAEDLVVALRNQAHLEIDEGRYAAAERAAQEAVNAGRETLGEEHPETVAALLMRAYAYQFSRSPDTALMTSARAYLAAVAAHRESPRHPRVIEGRLLYGRALGEAGETARGVRYLSRAVSDAAEVFGPSSRMVGFFSLPLAKFQLEAGEIAGAIEHSRRAADIIARHTRPESFRYATAIHHRGAALLAARRADEALPDLTAAATTLQAVLPPGHEITRAFQADQALALARAGRHHQARAFLEPLLPGPGSPVDRSGARLLYALGVASRLSGEFEAAVRVQRQALQSLARLPAVEPERMRVLTETGLALLDLGRHDEAAAPLEQALALSRQVQTQLAPDRADILVGLGRAYMAGGRSAEAHELLVTASRFWQAFDADNRETASVARWLHPLKNLVRHNSQGTRHKEG